MGGKSFLSFSHRTYGFIDLFARATRGSQLTNGHPHSVFSEALTSTVFFLTINDRTGEPL